MAKFSEIKKFTRCNGYRISVSWSYLENTLNRYKTKNGAKLEKRS